MQDVSSILALVIARGERDSVPDEQDDDELDAENSAKVACAKSKMS